MGSISSAIPCTGSLYESVRWFDFVIESLDRSLVVFTSTSGQDGYRAKWRIFPPGILHFSFLSAMSL